MPRDANGNYTLPAGNPVVSGTVIESAWANALTSDLALEMTDSLSRSGKGGFTGPVQIVDSDGAIPGLAFVNEPTSGLKRTAAGDVRMQIQSDDRMRWRVGAAQRPEVQDSGVWKPVALEEAGQKIMRGEGGVTVIFSHNNTAAPGWSIEEPDANIRELVIGPAASGGTIGGSIDPTSLTQNITVSISGNTGDIATPHTHTYSGTTGNANTGPYNLGGGGFPSVPPTHEHDYNGTTSAASDTTHNHTFSDTDDIAVAISPRYARGILMKLDA